MTLPLAGIRVLSLAEQYPGPYASLVMADLGAEVVVVERLAGGDPARAFPDFHAALNRNKSSVALDLKSAQGKLALRRLLDDADVLMEGFRPGVMQRLGFGYDDVAAINPRVVYVSISGFGQTGPYRYRPAHDLSYQSIAGLLSAYAEEGRLQPVPDLAVGDLSSAMFAITGTLSALLLRERSGKGVHVDVSMTDGLVSWMSAMLGPTMNGGRALAVNDEPGYGIYRCGDGALLTLSIAYEDWFWKPLCELLDMADAAGLTQPQRLAQAAALRTRIARALATRSRAQWGELLDGRGVPWGPVNTLAEVASDPHFRERGAFREVADEDGRRRWHLAQPLLFDGHRPGPVRGVPTLGQDNDRMLRPVPETGVPDTGH